MVKNKNQFSTSQSHRRVGRLDKKIGVGFVHISDKKNKIKRSEMTSFFYKIAIYKTHKNICIEKIA